MRPDLGPLDAQDAEVTDALTHCETTRLFPIEVSFFGDSPSLLHLLIVLRIFTVQRRSAWIPFGVLAPLLGQSARHVRRLLNTATHRGIIESRANEDRTLRVRLYNPVAFFGAAAFDSAQWFRRGAAPPISAEDPTPAGLYLRQQAAAAAVARRRPKPKKAPTIKIASRRGQANAE